MCKYHNSLSLGGANQLQCEGNVDPLESTFKTNQIQKQLYFGLRTHSQYSIRCTYIGVSYVNGYLSGTEKQHYEYLTAT